MTDAETIGRLVKSGEYVALQKLAPEFNVFALLNETLAEPAWSRMFAGLLDSTRGHGLGTVALRAWLAEVVAGGAHGAIPSYFANLPATARTRATVEYTTPGGRRVDVLVRVLDRRDRVLAVIGIENKLDSPEQRQQICDYQAALSSVFPRAHRLIVYLTPDGREPKTVNRRSDSGCVTASYRTAVTTCRKLATTARPEVKLLLASMSSEIEDVVLGEPKMNRQARDLVRRLWQDPDHRHAMRLIAECVPKRKELWQTRLAPKIEASARSVGLNLDKGWMEFHPESKDSPQEIKICCGGSLGRASDPMGFYVYYMLRSSVPNPDVGSEFTLRVLAWCDSQAARTRVKALALHEGLPAGGGDRAWGQWESIWTGGSYTLQDLDRHDVDGLAKLVRDALRKTYRPIAKKLLGARGIAKHGASS